MKSGTNPQIASKNKSISCVFWNATPSHEPTNVVSRKRLRPLTEDSIRFELSGFVCDGSLKTAEEGRSIGRRDSEEAILRVLLEAD